MIHQLRRSCSPVFAHSTFSHVAGDVAVAVAVAEDDLAEGCLGCFRPGLLLPFFNIKQCASRSVSAIALLISGQDASRVDYRVIISLFLTDDDFDHSSFVCSRRAQRCWRLRTHDFGTVPYYCVVGGLETTRLLVPSFA